MIEDVLNVIPEDDGYTENCYLAAVPNIHGAVRFKYRPMLHAERLAIAEAMSRHKPDEASLLAAQTVCKFVKSWSLSEKISVSVASRLKPSLLQRMYMVVNGFDGGDLDPQAKPSESQVVVDIEAVLGGKPAAAAREEADVGNSSGG